MDRVALVVAVWVPPWSPRADVEQAWTRLEPLVGAAESGHPLGVLLGGRLVEAWASLLPDAVRRLREQLDAGRVELLASALHGPVVSAVPQRDVEGQLAGHLTLLKRVLGVRPQGAWIPHGVWDPMLPRLLGKAGLSWTLLDRRFLSRMGVPTARVLSVEREGRAVAVLPAGPLDAEGEGLRVATLGDEAVSVACVQVLERCHVLPSALLDGPRARAYLPGGDADGLWERNLLVDAGADALHKRMLAVSRLVRRLDKTLAEERYADDGPDPHSLQQAKRYLYRSQAAEAYAPSSSSGIHGAWRDRAWRDLLRAEKTTRTALKRPEWGARHVDFDCDGVAEARLWTEGWSATLAPGHEGTLTEISQRGVAMNVLCGAVPLAFRERFDLEPAALDWELVTTEPGGDGSMRGVMCADSTLDAVAVRLTKQVRLPARGPMEVRIDIDNRGLEGARGHLSTELFCTLGGPRLEGHEEASLSVEVAGGKVPLDESITLPDLDAIALIGWRARLQLESDPVAKITVEPLEQGAARVVLSWPIELWGRERERRTVRLNVREEPHG